MKRGLPAAAAALIVTVALATGAHATHDLTELHSIGPAGGNGAATAAYAGASEDGGRLFFTTIESLVSADTDGRIDLYERANGVTTLLSTGSAGGNGPYNAFFSGASADGQRVFFGTSERLVAADTDSQNDVYERAGGTTTLLSTGPAAENGPYGAFFDGASSDGTHVFFHTAESLEGGDADSQTDIYDASGGTSVRVSTGPAGGNGASPAFFGGASADGTAVFFETSESLTADDTDSSQDVYRRAAGATIRYSLWNASHPGNGAFDAYYEANSQDGEYALYSTEEALATNDCDTDAQFDIYQRGSASPSSSLRSFGACGGGPFDAQFVGASPDLANVWFETQEQILAADTDTSRDVYQDGPGKRLVSIGPAGGNGAFDARFAGAARSGPLVYFETDEALVSGDLDATTDVYAYDRSAATSPPPTQQISTGPGGGNGAFDARFEGSSDDGLRTFFSTDESLIAQDTDANTDVYERQPPATSRLSTGPAGGNGPHDAQFAGRSSEGDTVFFTTSESLVSGDTDATGDIYSRRDTAGYVRPAGATPMRLSLVPAYQACSTPNRVHGSPLAFGSCSPPQRTTAHTTFGTPEVNGAPPGLIGSVKLNAIPGGGPEQAEADVRVEISITDVRRQSDNADYTGELAAFANLRITDRGSGPSGSEPATVTDIDQRLIAVACGATGGSAGATCAGFTTMNAILPGSVLQGRRSVWQVGQLRVDDGGADGDVDTTPNSTVAKQGVFVP